MPFRSVRLLAFAIPGLALVGCATYREPTYGLSPTDAAFVRQTCRQTMGLPPGMEEFDACAESLADSLHQRIYAHRLGEAHAACERQGFADGTAAIAQCVVLSEKTARVGNEAPAAAPRAAAPNAPALPALTHVSYFSMSNHVQDQRERLACAQLGLDPVTSEFRDCVMGIKQAIFTVQNPL